MTARRCSGATPPPAISTAKIKKSGLKLAPEAVPIKGQVARLIRLGPPGRSSLSRVQFLAGDKPVAATCSCTPLTLPDGERGAAAGRRRPDRAEMLRGRRARSAPTR